MEIWQLITLALLGILAGTLNVVAGGGTLLTLPAMVLMGMPGPVANGTNRVAILAQNLTAITGFRSKGFSDFRLSLTLALAALPGAIAGAFAGTLVRGEAFDRVLAVIMIAILVHMVLQESRKRKRQPKTQKPGTPSSPAAEPAPLSRRQLWLGHLLMAGVGLYGGFIQAGVGFLLMAVLHQVMGLDLVRVNMHKVFIVAVYTLAALAVFVARDSVLWVPGLTLAVGNSIGGWIGSHLSVSKGEKLIRRVLYIALLAMALRLLW